MINASKPVFCLPMAMLLLLLCLALASCHGNEANVNEETLPHITLSELFRVGNESAGDSILFGESRPI